ncbi:MAG: YbaB/EbfC family nucleoid-associated protein [Patescibacteria group bacterium]
MFDQMKAVLKARAVQNELKKTEIDAASREDLVKVTVTGELKLKEIHLADAIVDVNRKAELERLIQTTVAEALARAQQIAAEKTREAMKDMGVNIPGL